MADPLPVARYSPVSGVFISRHAKKITISGKLEVFGDEATIPRAGQIRTSINSNWTATFTDGFQIACLMTVAYSPPGTKTGVAGQIEVLKMTGPSNWDGSEINLNANDGAVAFTWVVAHEFGHMIGLKDRYSEGIISKIKGKLGYKRSTTIQKGYESNMMGKHKGKLERKNVKDLIGENAPSWLARDDRVRAWVSSSTLSQIRAVSTANKIKLIDELMSGWISNGDLAAIVRVLSSVKAATEASKIRKAIDLTDFSGLGQRMRARIAMDNMPR